MADNGTTILINDPTVVGADSEIESKPLENKPVENIDSNTIEDKTLTQQTTTTEIKDDTQENPAIEVKIAGKPDEVKEDKTDDETNQEELEDEDTNNDDKNIFSELVSDIIDPKFKATLSNTVGDINTILDKIEGSDNINEQHIQAFLENKEVFVEGVDTKTSNFLVFKTYLNQLSGVIKGQFKTSIGNTKSILQDKYQSKLSDDEITKEIEKLEPDFVNTILFKTRNGGDTLAKVLADKLDLKEKGNGDNKDDGVNENETSTNLNNNNDIDLVDKLYSNGLPDSSIIKTEAHPNGGSSTQFNF